MMLAIKEAASDMSPYVRKTAAHAIPKLYRWRSNTQQAVWAETDITAHIVLLVKCDRNPLSDLNLYSSLPRSSAWSCVLKIISLFLFLHSLDPEQKDQLIEVIEKLLADKTTVSF